MLKIALLECTTTRRLRIDEMGAGGCIIRRFLLEKRDHWMAFIVLYDTWVSIMSE